MATDTAFTDVARPPRRICYAEDDPDIRRLVSIILDRAGFRTSIYANGLDALRAAQLAPADLYVLDVRMPGLNGDELCRMLRADPRTSAVPVLLISAESEGLAQVAHDVGADAYLTKPFSRSQLLGRINALLDPIGGKDAIS